jgi:colanic acid biosynthesis glycosyl transferase WcaI
VKRIFVHDFAGHPFQVELSRELARRGMGVTHLCFGQTIGPRGELELRADDPPNFRVIFPNIGRPYTKYSFVKRWFQEREYARNVCEYVRSQRPDIVISANAPLEVQAALRRTVQNYGGKFIFWLQDIQSVAMQRFLPRSFPVLGRLIAKYYSRLEQATLRRSNHIIAISDDFSGWLGERGIGHGKTTVIENWAPKTEICPLPKDNAWARKHGLVDKRVFLYAGTLAMKHNPQLLQKLAESYAHDPSVAVVLISEGLGADWLQQQLSEGRCIRLQIFPVQSFADLPSVLATGDVLISVIEADAAQFSVPSKVLSYLAAGRSVLLSAPPENLASRVLARCGAGVVVKPGDYDGFVEAARALIEDEDRRTRCAAAARDYANRNFDIRAIADRFLKLFED